MKKVIENTILLTLAGMAIFLLVFAVISTPIPTTTLNQSYVPDIGYFYKDCEVFADDIIIFSECVNDRVKTKFSYIVSPDNPYFGMKEYNHLMTSGGDCYDWALFYDMIFTMTADVTGAYSEVVIIDLDNTTAHAFNIVSTTDGYCKLDQEDISCFRLG